MRDESFIAAISRLVSSSSSGALRDQIAPPEPDCTAAGAEGEDPVHEATAAMAELAQQGRRFSTSQTLAPTSLRFAMTPSIARIDGSLRASIALPPYPNSFCATCGVMRMRRTAATQARMSYALSAATVRRRVVSGNSPASRSRHHVRPCRWAAVTAVSTNQAVAILGQQMREIPSLASRPTAFL